MAIILRWSFPFFIDHPWRIYQGFMSRSRLEKDLTGLSGSLFIVQGRITLKRYN